MSTVDIDGQCTLTGETALTIAAANGCHNTCSVLISRGCRISATNRKVSVMLFKYPTWIVRWRKTCEHYPMQSSSPPSSPSHLHEFHVWLGPQLRGTFIVLSILYNNTHRFRLLMIRKCPLWCWPLRKDIGPPRNVWFNTKLQWTRWITLGARRWWWPRPRVMSQSSNCYWIKVMHKYKRPFRCEIQCILCVNNYCQWLREWKTVHLDPKITLTYYEKIHVDPYKSCILFEWRAVTDDSCHS